MFDFFLVFCFLCDQQMKKVKSNGIQNVDVTRKHRMSFLDREFHSWFSRVLGVSEEGNFGGLCVPGRRMIRRGSCSPFYSSVGLTKHRGESE